MPLPKFHNDPAHREITIGAQQFACIGVLPPHDHPHVFLTFESGVIMCPYCSTLFRFDPKLGPTESQPAGLYYADNG